MTNLTTPYEIVYPAIPSAGLYYFTTDSGMRYEVRFGRKQNDLLSATIVFGVINDEFEGEEYVVTNKGEVFRVMATIVEIVKSFRKQHPNIRSYEFTGEPTSGEVIDRPTKRLRLYSRYLRNIFEDDWCIERQSNKVVISKPFSFH